MMLSATWKAYFISRADNERGNQNTSIYTTAWAKEVPRATKLSILVSNPDTILFAADTDGTLIALHSFANLGGPYYARLTSLFALLAQAMWGCHSLLMNNQQLRK